MAKGDLKNYFLASVGADAQGRTGKKKQVASKMTGNPKGVMEKNNKTMMEIDKHNRSWNGKKYTYNKK